LSESNRVLNEASDNKISIDGVISQSYTYFMNNFSQFITLAMIPIILWVYLELATDYLYMEHAISYNTVFIRALISASFALIWYRQFLMGSEHATYPKFLEHLLSTGKFRIGAFLKSILRIAFLTIILIVPALIISIAMMIYKYSEGILMNERAIQEIAVNSTAVVMFLFSPIMIRFSLYSISVALGRRNLGFRKIWHKTKGYTWVLWLLTLRAFLPISLDSYSISVGFAKIADKLEMYYLWKKWNYFGNLNHFLMDGIGNLFRYLIEQAMTLFPQSLY
jgi:hypothetical protein